MAHTLLVVHLQKAVTTAAKLDAVGRRALQEFFAAALDFEQTYAAKARNLGSYAEKRKLLDGDPAKAKAAAVRQSAENLKQFGIGLTAFDPLDLAQAVAEMYAHKSR